MTDKEKLIKIKKLTDAMYYAAQYLTTDASRLHKAMKDYHQFIIHEYRKEEPVSIWHDASEKPERDDLLIETNDGRIIHRQSINNYGMVKRWAYTSALLNLDNSCNLGNNSQEEPVSKEFEKTFISFVNATHYNNGSYFLHDFAQRLYNIAKEELKEPVSEDLEEAADNAFNNVLNTHEIVNVRSCFEMFRFGAQWQKEQMTKEAVEATVYNKAYPTEFEIETNTFMQKLKHGDKVKVIIIKED